MEQANAARPEAGDVWALLPAGWWEGFKAFVGLGGGEGADMAVDGPTQVGVDAPPPPPINTSVLLLSGGRLRPGLEEGQDFVRVPREAWEALHSWYGGGPAVLRTVVEPPEGGVELSLDGPDAGAALLPAASKVRAEMWVCCRGSVVVESVEGSTC
jgi:hypothetical protein